MMLTEKEQAFIESSILTELPETTIYYFGSRVTGKAKKYSDIDIALDNKAPISLSTLSKLEEVFSNSDFPYIVDLIDWHRISEEFQQEIISQQKTD